MLLFLSILLMSAQQLAPRYQFPWKTGLLEDIHCYKYLSIVKPDSEFPLYLNHLTRLIESDWRAHFFPIGHYALPDNNNTIMHLLFI